MTQTTRKGNEAERKMKHPSCITTPRFELRCPTTLSIRPYTSPHLFKESSLSSFRSSLSPVTSSSDASDSKMDGDVTAQALMDVLSPKKYDVCSSNMTLLLCGIYGYLISVHLTLSGDVIVVYFIFILVSF